MPDYRGKPKDHTQRFEVIENHDTVLPGAVFIGVRQVGSAFSAYRAVVDSAGHIFESISTYPHEAEHDVLMAKGRVAVLSRSRRDATVGMP